MAHSLTQLQVMHTVLKNGLESGAPTADVPPDALKVQLRVHQQAMLYKMENLEKRLSDGWDISGETFHSNWACLGDSVGVGKSLMVLGHISRMLGTGIQSTVSITRYGSPHVFSIKRNVFTDVSEGNALIVVPHTLFRQWADYIKKQTNLKAMYLDKKKALTAETFLEDLLRAQVVLVSNTMYKEFSTLMHHHRIKWKRAYIDEADTIHLVSGYQLPNARFTWFITASWMNIIFPCDTLYLSRTTLANWVFSDTAQFKELRPHFQEFYNSARSFAYERYHVSSYNFFREVLSSAHPLRGHLVARCTDAFIQESITLPPLFRRNILCRQSITHRIVHDAVSQDVRDMLHAGDVAGAMEALGVKAESTQNLIDAVTKTQHKELERLKATLEFKSKLEYSTPAAKETALKSLQEKIVAAENQIKFIEQRIANYKEEMCPICYDEPGEPCLTPCCQRVFCGTCILESIARNPSCPMCRSALGPKSLTRLRLADDNAIVDAGASAAAEPDLLEKKPQALLRLFQENPAGRFLVFSRYDNPFLTIEPKLLEMGVRVKQLKGNKDAIAATLRAFQGGDLRCLLLNAHYAGAGLNITGATHVVLLHAMTMEEEKQILGRAYRMGRTGPLHFIKLLHEGESVDVA